ncbi:ABC transporter permease [Dyella caseinilytica]|uniref:ABC transporter permease n=1 Tax=Dyella caseinilytica TaxID=1849581 RepID=A0ABX7GQS1_9GAMM|nr:ABC transporter permease [Dyella caseinilytica]QRN52774.1 ABC transporter permease [Dyella caseinilytica]GGA08632.1 ABC transporter ATP-binding protein [Dyella caseinilytica]
MLSYYVDLALRSLKRSPGLTLLMILAVGFGVGASMTSYSVFRAVSGDPIPWKSSRLFVPQIDIWGPQGHLDDTNKGDPPEAMDYTDAVALMRDHRAKFQSAMYQISPSVVPADPSMHPINVGGHAVYSEFFPMLDVPFKYGSGWGTDSDEQRAAVVVISSKLNQKLFAGANSVGKTIDIDGKDYRVVGVLDNWNPKPVFYDVVNTGGFTTDQQDVFVPFQRAISAGMPNDGNTNCSEIPKGSGFVGLQQSSCVWIAYMAELDDKAAAAAYKDYLDGYFRDQKAAGRFSWPLNNRLRDLPAWLESEHVVPSDTKISLVVALGLLVVCLVNTAGLLLAKFLRRSSEIGVRRALGAPRAAIYTQFLVEAGTVGLTGGVLGIVLTWVGVWGVSWVLPKEISSLAHIDLSLLAITLLVAVIATMLAGLYPTFRASRVQPALQLKTN